MLALPPPTGVGAGLPVASVLPRAKESTFTVSTDLCEPLFVSATVDDWKHQELHARYNGLVVKRPFHGVWNPQQSAIDEALENVSFGGGLKAEVSLSSATLNADLDDAVSKLLVTAALPTLLSEQIQRDACSIGRAVASMCPTARVLNVRLELFGESICSRWHRDNFVGRAIVSYTGVTGTEYTGDKNVNFWELTHCGKNECIIGDTNQIKAVEVGDILFIKGSGYKGANALVHKSPQPRYHADGRVLNRLVLKVDVESWC